MAPPMRSKLAYALLVVVVAFSQLQLSNGTEARRIRHASGREWPEKTGMDSASFLDADVCRARAMDDRFHNLEAQMADQLNVLKTMVLNLEEKIGAMDVGIERSERRLLDAILRRGAGASVATRNAAQSRIDWEDIQDDETDVDDNTVESAGPRDAEAQAQNHTVHAEYAARGAATPTGCGNGRRVYNYYWRVAAIKYKMSNWSPQRSIRSPSFYIWRGGYRLYLRLFPRQSGDNVYVHVGLTRGDFDDTLRWPFALPHRLAILDQDQEPVDLVSRLWNPAGLCSLFNWQRPSTTGPADNYECVGLGFPQSILHTRAYLRNDSLLIRLAVCIDAE